jgi:chromosome segregation ATPase
MGAHEEYATKKDLITFKEEIIHEFHVVSEGLMDHIKLLAEGHAGVVQRLDRVDTRIDQIDTKLDGVEMRLDRVQNRLDHMEKENERQHIETRALIKLSFSELDNRLSSLESQVKELQEWKKEVQARLQI